MCVTLLHGNNLLYAMGLSLFILTPRSCVVKWTMRLRYKESSVCACVCYKKPAHLLPTIIIMFTLTEFYTQVKGLLAFSNFYHPFFLSLLPSSLMHVPKVKFHHHQENNILVLAMAIEPVVRTQHAHYGSLKIPFFQEECLSQNILRY